MWLGLPAPPGVWTGEYRIYPFEDPEEPMKPATEDPRVGVRPLQALFGGHMARVRPTAGCPITAAIQGRLRTGTCAVAACADGPCQGRLRRIP